MVKALAAERRTGGAVLSGRFGFASGIDFADASWDIIIARLLATAPTSLDRLKRAVARHGGPAVGKHLHMRPAGIDHRLDGEGHARLQG